MGAVGVDVCPHQQSPEQTPLMGGGEGAIGNFPKPLPRRPS